MIEVVFYSLILLFLFYFLFKGITNIIKGIIFFILAFSIFYIFFINPKTFQLPTISNFLKGINLSNLKILGYFYYDNKLYIVVKNDGIIPIRNFEIFLDERKENINNRPFVLLPKRITELELEKRDFKKITIVFDNKKVEYIK